METTSLNPENCVKRADLTIINPDDRLRVFFFCSLRRTHHYFQLLKADTMPSLHGDQVLKLFFFLVI